MADSWILEWFEYRRDSSGRLAQIVLYTDPGPDRAWLTADDRPGARVELTYGPGDRPAVATVFLASLSPANQLREQRLDGLRFLYDASGRWSGAVSETGNRMAADARRCREIPERAIMLLLSPLSGPFRPTLWHGSLR